MRFEERLEHNQRRAQAAYGDAGLMDSLGVASQRRGPVHQEVAERVDDDAAQRKSILVRSIEIGRDDPFRPGRSRARRLERVKLFKPPLARR